MWSPTQANRRLEWGTQLLSGGARNLVIPPLNHTPVIIAADPILRWLSFLLPIQPNGH